MMKKLMQMMFLSCLKATEFIEKKLNYRLSFKERLQLRVHTSMCKACSEYEKQSKLIEEVILQSEVRKIETKEIQDIKDSIIKKIAESK